MPDLDGPGYIKEPEAGSRANASVAGQGQWSLRPGNGTPDDADGWSVRPRHDDFVLGRDARAGLRTADYRSGRDDTNGLQRYSDASYGGGDELRAAKEVSAPAGYGGPGDAGAGQVQDEYTRSQQERFEKEYDNYRRYEEARGRKPKTKEEMLPAFTQFGTLDRKYLNTGFVLDLTKAYRAAGQHEIADARSRCWR